MTKKYKKYLVKELFIPRDYKFSSVERLLDNINENKPNEDWEKTAERLKYKYPEISKYLYKAYDNFNKRS